MAVATQNFTLHPQDGWVQITSANIASFLRITHYPCGVPVFITVGSTAPAGTPSGGFRICEGSCHFDGAITGNVYARISNNSNDKVNVSVFAN